MFTSSPCGGLHRRAFLGQVGVSVGAAALTTLLPARCWAHDSLPHHRPTAKRVIFLYMSGGPSHLELFDHKPELARRHLTAMPESFTRGQPIAQLQNAELKCFAPQFRFRRSGQSGQEISELLPSVSRVADDIAVVRSMHTDQINHDPAHTVMNTGTQISGRPSMGSWILYGLGSECENLPGFIVMTSFAGRNPQPISMRQWSAGFLPGQHQGVPFYSTGEPVHYLSNPPGISREHQRDTIDAVRGLNEIRQQRSPNPEISTRIAQYEMAFRMQTSVPELMDIANEPRHIKQLYGVESADGSFAYNCLLARRLAERGVRFIQLYHRDWDHHDNIVGYMRICAQACDRPTFALIHDLKQRGLLDDTLIIWGGEFGRTPMVQFKGREPGRDHHIRGFSMFLAGGGVKGGVTYGATDELGYRAVDNPVHVRDLHATMLHTLGIDHTRLTYRHQGLDMRLTGVEPARVVQEILK
ncbi:MAG: DUF1501 domain-containing protein [Planctomycetes bacterium]|nr:DUF1501 domain-containing protein [Planctomycetota bacterium]